MIVKRVLAIILIICLCFPATLCVAASEAEKKFGGYVWEDFEFKDSNGSWRIYNTSVAKLSLSKKYAVSGNQSLKYSYNYARSEIGISVASHRKGGAKINNTKRFNYIGFWCYGNGSGDFQIGIEVFNSEGANKRLGLERINFVGWKYIEFPIPSGFSHDIHFNQLLLKKDASDMGDVGELYFDDITLSKESYYETLALEEGVTEAGMWGGGGTSTVITTGVLNEVELPPSTMENPQVSQIGNENKFSVLNYRNPRDLPDSISGVAEGHATAFFNIMPGVRADQWGTGWLNDGESLYGKVNTVYGSGMHNTENNAEAAMITFAQTEVINKISIIPRTRGVGFPVDYKVEVSEDGEKWDVIADVKNQQFAVQQADMPPVVFEFEPREALCVRISGSKLRAEGAGIYYFQLREIEAYNTDGVNVACYTEGGIPWSSSVSNDAIMDYDRYMDDVVGSGVKWFNIVNHTFVSDYENGKEPFAFYEKEGVKFLHDNGINITYRLLNPLPDMNDAQAQVYAEKVADALVPVVNQHKDYIKTWQLMNENNFQGSSEQVVKNYVTVGRKMAERIKELDPDAKVEIETALIDRTWTENVLKGGLADVVDVIGIHVYKESAGGDQMPEGVGTFMDSGVRKYPEDQPYKDYMEEIEAYKKLVHDYNPNIEIWCTETCVNVGLNAQCVSELSQAKFLARMYILHQMIDVGPTCWWMLHYAKTLDTEWGLVDGSYRRRPAWYALRNVANTMNNDFVEDTSVKLSFGGSPDMIFKAYENKKTGVYQIPYWAAVKLRDGNAGKSVNLTVEGIDVKNAVAIDMLSGTVQPLNYQSDGKVTIFNDLVARDYPIVIRINSDEIYNEYTGIKDDDSNKTEAVVKEKTATEKIIESSIILKVNSPVGYVKGKDAQLSQADINAAPFVKDDVSYVPARFLSEELGKYIYWLDGVIVISSSKLEMDEQTKKEVQDYANNRSSDAAQ